jgi:hypothetical protein
MQAIKSKIIIGVTKPRRFQGSLKGSRSLRGFFISAYMQPFACDVRSGCVITVNLRGMGEIE